MCIFSVRSVVCVHFVSDLARLLADLGRFVTLIISSVGSNVLQCSSQRSALKALKHIEHDTTSATKGRQLEPRRYQKLAQGLPKYIKRSGREKRERPNLEIESF